MDGVAEVIARAPTRADSTRVTFRAPEALARFIAEKGSIALDGTSLTVNEVEGATFGVNLIPHTKEVTTWGGVARGAGREPRGGHDGPLRGAAAGMGVTAAAGLGHNGGPSMDEGVAWRTYAWTRGPRGAAPDACPSRSCACGSPAPASWGSTTGPTRACAPPRAATSIGFLYSTNALRLLRPTDALPEDRRARLAAVAGADRTALVQPPLDPAPRAGAWPRSTRPHRRRPPP